MPGPRPERVSYPQPDRDPWAQHEGETARAYECFRTYLRQDPPRALKVTSEALGISITSVRNYSKRNHWRARADAWDAEVQRRADNSTLKAAERIRASHLQALDLLRKRSLLVIADKSVAGSLGEARAMLETAIKLERLILGEATERTETSTTVLAGARDLSRLSDEELEAYHALLDKMRGAEDE